MMGVDYGFESYRVLHEFKIDKLVQASRPSDDL